MRRLNKKSIICMGLTAAMIISPLQAAFLSAEEEISIDFSGEVMESVPDIPQDIQNNDMVLEGSDNLPMPAMGEIEDNSSDMIIEAEVQSPLAEESVNFQEIPEQEPKIWEGTDPIDEDTGLTMEESGSTEEYSAENDGTNETLNNTVSESNPDLAEITIGEEGLELNLSDVISADSPAMLNIYDIISSWEGVYTDFIEETETQRIFQIDIEDCTEDGTVLGMGAIEADTDQRGIFCFKGSVDLSTGEILIGITEWLENPADMTVQTFSGKIDMESLIMTGVVDGDKSRTFTLSRNVYAFDTITTQTYAASNTELPDYDIWMAQTMINGYNNEGNGLYPSFQTMADPVYRELGGYLLDDAPLVSISTAWSVFFNSEYRNQFLNEQKYIYEVLLMEYLKYESANGTISTVLDNKSMEISLSLYSLITKDISENTYDYITNMSVEEAIQFYKKAETLGDMSEAISYMKDGVNSVKGLINAISEYMSLRQTKEERIYLLKAARSASGNQDFNAAADELINIIEGSPLVYVQNKSGDYLWNEGLNYVWGKLCEATPFLNTIELSVSGIDEVFDTSNRASNDLKLALLYTTDSYMKQGMMKAASDFVGNHSSVNARTFLASFQAYAQFQMYGNDYSKTWLEGYLDGGAFSDAINLLFYRENLKTAQELIARCDSQIATRKSLLGLIDKYAKAYQDQYKEPEWEELISDSVPVTGVHFRNPQVTLAHTTDIFVSCADIEPVNATNKNITYTSSQPGILEIPEKGGFANIKGSGTVTITARTEEGGYTATQTVTIGDRVEQKISEDKMCGENAKYRLLGDGTLYIYGSGEVSEINERSSVYKVVATDNITSIGDSVFSSYINLKSVSLPMVKSIGMNAFYGCSSLLSVNLPMMESVGDQAFIFCGNLNSVSFPEAKTIGKYAFYMCDNLDSVSFPKAKSIGEYVFFKCKNLSSVSLPMVTSISGNAFESCINLSSVNLSAATYVGVLAFYNCENLSSISLPAAEKIENTAFAHCSNLSSISLLTMENIEDKMFQNVESLSIVNLPAAKYIGVKAFENCNNLNSVNLPAAIEINDSAFLGCSSLNSVSLPAAKHIYYEAFRGCSNLNSVSLPAVESIGGRAFCDCDDLSSVNLPVAKEIWSYAFADCNNLSSVSLPMAEVISIGVFENCSNLESVSLPMVESIEGKAFRNCVKLSNVNLPVARVIGESEGETFENCDNLSNVNLPMVESIQVGTFANCDSLSSVSLPAAINIGPSAFAYCNNLSNINLPKAESIVNEAFYNCDNLNSVNLPAAKEIFPYAFSGCDNLSNVNLPMAWYIMEGSFADCGNLSSLSLPAAGHIGVKAFENCNNLNSVSLPKVISIDDSAFLGCSSLNSVSLPEVMAINDSAFLGCSSLISVSTGTIWTVTIGDKAFANCVNLSSVSLPIVESIGEYVFYECINLSSVSLPVARSIGSSAFEGCNKDILFLISQKGSYVEKYALENGLKFKDIDNPDGSQGDDGSSNNPNTEGQNTGSQNTGTPDVGSQNDGNPSTEGQNTENQNTGVPDAGSQNNDNPSTENPNIENPKPDEQAPNNSDVNTQTSETQSENNLPGESSENVASTTVAKVTSLTLNTSSTAVQKGKKIRLSVAAMPPDAADSSVRWSTSNKKIATVSADGVVTGIKYGTATITATAADGSGISAQCKVTVGYGITYKLSGGQNSSANPAAYYKSAVTPKNPTRKGYVFKGWYTDKKLKKKLTKISAGSKKNLTLYAKWEKVSVGKSSISSLKNSAGKKAVLKFKKVSKASGYEVIYSTDKKFKKGCKTAAVKKASATLKRLTKGKTYYVKVRAYKKDSAGKKVYGKYSAVKQIKIRK